MRPGRGRGEARPGTGAGSVPRRLVAARDEFYNPQLLNPKGVQHVQNFKGIMSGDRVKFWAWDGFLRGHQQYRRAEARAIRFLCFETHVMVNLGHNGTLVDATNYISHTPGRAHKV